jgi:tetratricopeptide (TPR) repeat protein
MEDSKIDSYHINKVVKMAFLLAIIALTFSLNIETSNAIRNRPITVSKSKQSLPNDAKNKNYSEHLSEGFNLAKSKEYEEAIKHYKEAIKINKKYTRAWLFKGAALGELGMYDDAIGCFDEVIRLLKEESNGELWQLSVAWYYKGLTYSNLGSYRNAIECYEETIKTNSKFIKAWHGKGVALLKIGNAEEASNAFYEARSKELKEYKYWMSQITSLYEEGKLDRSLDLCEKGIEYFKKKKKT